MIGIIIIVLVTGAVVADLTLSQTTGLTDGVTPFVTLFGTMTVSSGSDAGVLSLTVRNSADYPFVGIKISSISPSLAGAVDNPVFIYNGAAVSESNPLPIGESANWVYDVGSGANTSSIYSIVATVTLGDGQTVIADATITTQT
jgi:hypothetical protein